MYVLTLNGYSDILEFSKYGLNQGQYTRVITSLGVCLTYAYIYYRKQNKLKHYFAQKSKEFAFIDENQLDEN